MRTTRLRARLEDVETLVQRVVDLPASSTVEDVHHALQAALGWTDRHLFEVRAGEVRYGPFDAEDPEVVDARTASLKDLPSTFTYDYDFGDAWSVAVHVLGAGGEQPGLVYGEGDEPDEDIGGGPGYEEALVAGELRPYDADRIGARVRRVVGRVPAGLQVVLDVIADGVKLTAQGRLPQTVVREVQRRRPDWHPLGAQGRPARREDDLQPLAALQDFVRKTHLARVRHGILAPTKAAGDPFEVLRRTRAEFSPETFLGLVVDVLVTRLFLEGPQDLDTLAADLHALFGQHWGRHGSRLTEDEMYVILVQNCTLLRGLDQVDDHHSSIGHRWSVGAEAGWLLPRTALVVPERP